MNKTRFCMLAAALAAVSTVFQSCDDDDDYDYVYYGPTAVVTVCPSTDGEGFSMVLDDNTVLNPVNTKKYPFDNNKEVRALVNYTEAKAEDAPKTINQRDVNVNWIDSIRTKLPIAPLAEGEEDKFGNDPIEIVKDWVTVAEDGYLTLRIRTLWGNALVKHNIDLVSVADAENPYKFELRHDAKGDIYGRPGDALIAFNLNEIITDAGEEPVKLTIVWNSFDGEKTHDFDLKMRRKPVTLSDAEALVSASSIE